MELRSVNPRSLIDNPDNPRHKLPSDHADEQMRKSVAIVGILQPPVVREMAKGLTVRYGSRRLRAALDLKLDRMDVLVLGPDEREDDDEIRAMLENVVRKQMSPVDQWRNIRKLDSDRWTEEAISNVLVLPVRTIRKLRLLGSIHPPMLDRMHGGDMPSEAELRHIASAPAEEQAAVWKRCKPKKGEETDWDGIAGALGRRRLKASDALFDAQFAEAYGVSYEEDLFAPAGEDSRTTANVEGFLAAQQAWVEEHLPENGVVLTPEAYGGVKLPAQAMRHYGPPDAPGVKLGFCLDADSGKVWQVLFTMPAPASRGGGEAGADGMPDAPASKPRADVTQGGTAMIGHMRTDALHAALQREPIDDGQLIALLVLALAGQNVEIKTGAGQDHMAYGTRAGIAQPVIEGGAVTSDPEVLRAAARAMLVHTLSCRENFSHSGPAARIAGAAIGADAHLPSMATQEFLSCLSKKALEAVAVSLNVRVQPTGKATRLDVISKVGAGRWIYPAAAFAPVAGERARDDAPEYRPADDLMSTGGEDRGEDGDGAGDAGDEPEEDGDDPILPPPAALTQPGPEPRAAA
jgi:ParB family chromosome partitioning protein